MGGGGEGREGAARARSRPRRQNAPPATSRPAARLHPAQKESSDVFFSVTKLFQARDPHLRRLVYLIVKQVCPGPDEVIIITSSLMKDMTSSVDLYRANATRVLCAIADGGLLGQVERYLQQAVVDAAPAPASAVLVSALHLLAPGGDGGSVVRRWGAEVAEAAASRHAMVQFHAVAVSHALRGADRLAVSKLVSSLVRAGVRSPLAQVLLVRYAARAGDVAAGAPPGTPRPFADFIESCTRHKAEAVIIEAARALARAPGATAAELAPAISVLQLFLSSSKPVLRCAAARTLAALAVSHPAAVAPCNPDLETLVTDPNRSVATLAITTLLKTGGEASVERLLAQIGGFMGDIGDDFRVVVVGAVRALCAKFPSKHRALLVFLAGALRDDGGADVKRAVVDAVLGLVRSVPAAREPGLGHLCEFIEDCEFASLSASILHVLGEEGPATADPGRYVRHAANRVILEAAPVRAAAVSCLARFGAALPELRPRIAVLLARAAADEDDEVRDRAALALAALAAAPAEGPAPERPAVGPRALEASLKVYLAGDAVAPFDVAAVPADAAAPPPPRGADEGLASAPGAPPPPPPPAAAAAAAAAALASVPALAALGAPLATAPPATLTEEGTEYAVVLTKHVYPTRIVLAFEVANTVEDTLLDEVSVAVEAGEGLTPHESIPIPSLPAGPPATAYVLLDRDPAPAMPTGALRATLRFKAREVDPTTGAPEEGGYDDEYALEDVVIAASDYMTPAAVPDWSAAWDAAGEEGEVADTYDLGPRESLQDAADAVLATLPLAACAGTDAAPPLARSHALLLAGRVAGRGQVLARVALGATPGGGVAMQVAARGAGGAAEAVHDVVAEG